LKAYFDTSALVPLLIDEPGTDAAGTAWDLAENVISVRLIYAEARAALAQAARVGRITSANHDRAVRGLDELVEQMEFVEVDDALVRLSGDLAQDHALRGYDAVHLASALRVGSPDVVLVAGDGSLLAAAGAEGLATARIA
jgi:predicted nucleic acid-binding protein